MADKPPRRLEPLYGALWCKECGMQWKPIQYCTCKPLERPEGSAASDSLSKESLDARIRECQGK